MFPNPRCVEVVRDIATYLQGCDSTNIKLLSGELCFVLVPASISEALKLLDTIEFVNDIMSSGGLDYSL